MAAVDPVPHKEVPAENAEWKPAIESDCLYPSLLHHPYFVEVRIPRLFRENVNDVGGTLGASTKSVDNDEILRRKITHATGKVSLFRAAELSRGSITAPVPSLAATWE